MILNSPHLVLAAELAAQFAALACVEAVAVGGSLASGAPDPHSDIDLYVFTSGEIPLAARQEIVATRGASRADLDLRFWDLGDEWFDCETGIEVDVIYWDTAWIQGQIERVLTEHQPSMGYGTCFWHTLRQARILQDRHGWLGQLQERCAAPYPEPLRRAIIVKNHAVLRSVIPAYLHQIAKAARRGDLVSLNHRLATLLASYFDILFALNRATHPGEKRLVQLAAALPMMPTDMAAQVRALLEAAAWADECLLVRVGALLDGLDALLLAEGWGPELGLARTPDAGPGVGKVKLT